MTTSVVRTTYDMRLLDTLQQQIMPSPPTEDILPYAGELLPRSLHFTEEGKAIIVSYLYHGIVYVYIFHSLIFVVLTSRRCWNISAKTWQWRIQTGTRM